MSLRATPKGNITRTPPSNELVEEAKKLAFRPYQTLFVKGVPIKALDLFIERVFVSQVVKFRKEWGQPKNMKPHTLKRFPERICKLAKQIDGLNSDTMLEPLHLLVPERQENQSRRDLVQEMRSGVPDRARIAYEFLNLPRLMREYADFLNIVAHAIGRSRRRTYNPLHHRLVAFTEFVRQTTGHLMYEEIADLANALIAMIDERAKIIDPVNLARLYQHNPHQRSGIAFDQSA